MTYPSVRDALLKDYWVTLEAYKAAWNKFDVSEPEYIDAAIAEVNTLAAKLDTLSRTIGTIM